MKSFFLICFVLIQTYSFPKDSNYQYDSISRILKVKVGEERINEGLKIAKSFSSEKSELAEKLAKDLLDYSKIMRNPLNMANCYQSLGFIYQNRNTSPSLALTNYKNALKLYVILKNRESQWKCIRSIVSVYSELGETPKIFEMLFLEIKRNPNDIEVEIVMNSLIALTFKEIANVKSAMKYYNMSEEKFKAIKSPSNYLIAVHANNCKNMGVLYRNQHDNKHAFLYFEISLKAAKLIRDSNLIASNLNSMGILYSNNHNYIKAIDLYQQSLKYKEAAKNYNGIITTLNNMVSINITLKNYEEAQKLLDRAIELSRKRRVVSSMPELINNSANLLSAKGNYKEAFQVLVSYIELNDSLQKDDISKQTARMEAQFQNEKKSKELELSSLKIEKQESDLSAKNKERNYFIYGILFLIVLLIIAFWSYLEKIKSNVKINYTNTLLEIKNKEVADSIHYARKIQDAIFSSDVLRSKLFPESFFLYLPRDIVSGDFYWFAEKNEKKLVAAVDCTGHGVPGAFMSMIGNAFLNEIVNEKGITEPAEILNRLRSQVILSLKQEDSSSFNKDGMDMTICVFNKNNSVVEFAGANNPIYVIQNGILKEVKGDKQPIGIFTGTPLPFTNNTINLHKGDTVFLLTDGYADQFGGEKGKKFKYKKLQSLLSSINNKPISEQHQILLSTHLTWKGELDQVDDILLIGIKV